MANIYHVIFFSLIGGLFSLVGGVLLLLKKNKGNIIDYATPFAAGALLAAAFLDILADAASEGDIGRALNGTLAGIVIFFLMERFIRWFHHHHEHENKSSDPRISLIIFGDTLHNVIDGVALAAAFLVSVDTGIVVTVALAAHEIPQEIGDFGLLLKKGMSSTKVLIVNIISALATTVAAIVVFYLGNNFYIPLDIILGITAGFFIYIATSDIIPSIHKAEGKRLAGPQTFMLIFGILLIAITTHMLHPIIDNHHAMSLARQFLI